LLWWLAREELSRYVNKLQQVGGMEASREIAQVPTYCADDVKAFVQIDVCIVG
jgi:hypothetical protein